MVCRARGNGARAGEASNSNKGDGFNNNATNTNFISKKSNRGGKENVGAEYRFVKTAVNGGSNKADGVSVPAAAKGCTSFVAGQACE